MGGSRYFNEHHTSKGIYKDRKILAMSTGSTKIEVVNAFGNKIDFADCGEIQILEYGWYEFFYWTESELILGIQNDHLQADCTNHKEMIDY